MSCAVSRPGSAGAILEPSEPKSSERATPGRASCWYAYGRRTCWPRRAWPTRPARLRGGARDPARRLALRPPHVDDVPHRDYPADLAVGHHHEVTEAAVGHRVGGFD